MNKSQELIADFVNINWTFIKNKSRKWKNKRINNNNKYKKIIKKIFNF